MLEMSLKVNASMHNTHPSVLVECRTSSSSEIILLQYCDLETSLSKTSCSGNTPSTSTYWEPISAIIVHFFTLTVAADVSHHTLLHR